MSVLIILQEKVFRDWSIISIVSLKTAFNNGKHRKLVRKMKFI